MINNEAFTNYCVYDRATKRLRYTNNTYEKALAYVKRHRNKYGHIILKEVLCSPVKAMGTFDGNGNKTL